MDGVRCTRGSPGGRQGGVGELAEDDREHELGAALRDPAQKPRGHLTAHGASGMGGNWEEPIILG